MPGQQQAPCRRPLGDGSRFRLGGVSHDENDENNVDLGLHLQTALRAAGVTVFMCRVERYPDTLFATLMLKGFATQLQSAPGLDDDAAIADLVEKAKQA